MHTHFSEEVPSYLSSSSMLSWQDRLDCGAIFNRSWLRAQLDTPHCRLLLLAVHNRSLWHWLLQGIHSGWWNAGRVSTKYGTQLVVKAAGLYLSTRLLAILSL